MRNRSVARLSDGQFPTTSEKSERSKKSRSPIIIFWFACSWLLCKLSAYAHNLKKQKDEVNNCYSDNSKHQVPIEEAMKSFASIPGKMPSLPFSYMPRPTKSSNRPIELSSCYKYSGTLQANKLSSRTNEEAKSHAILLPWADKKGRDAEYTGQINEFSQPHGLGCLQYPNGTIITSEFINGTPVDSSSLLHAGPNMQQVKPSAEISQELELGDVASPRDILIPSSAHQAHEEAASLAIHSFAFILRSTGEWTYAILSDRPIETGPNASMRFVVNTEGNTKTLKAKHWASYIRLVQKKGTQEAKCPRNDMGRVQSDDQLARLNSFHKAARRVSLDMSTRASMKTKSLAESAKW